MLLYIHTGTGDIGSLSRDNVTDSLKISMDGVSNIGTTKSRIITSPQGNLILHH